MFAIVGVAVLAAVRGHRRWNDAEHYFIAADHFRPGVMAALAAMAFGVLGVLCWVLVGTGRIEPRTRRHVVVLAGVWMVATVDVLTHASNELGPAGTAVHVGYWVLFGRSVLSIRTIVTAGRRTMLTGFALLAVSETTDIVLTTFSRIDGRVQVVAGIVEETAMAAGGWCLVAGAAGFVVAQLSSPQRTCVRGSP